MQDDIESSRLLNDSTRSIPDAGGANQPRHTAAVDDRGVRRYGTINDDSVTDSDVQIVESITCCETVFPNGYKYEFKALWSLAVPIILTSVSEFMICVVAAIFCGHLGKTELAASALANSMINVTGVSIAAGMSSACDTLFSQIYGSSRKHKLGVALQKSLIIIPLCVFPCWALHLNAERLLLLLGQDPVASRLAGRYLLLYFPGLLAIFIEIPLAVYLQCQDIVLPGLVIGLCANVVNAVLQYVLLFVYNLGTDGSAIAQSVSCVFMLVCMVSYIAVSGIYKKTWSGWSMESLLNWGSFCKMGVLGLIMDCIEWWSFEVGIYLTGILGTTELDTQSVIFQLESMQYMIPLGIGISASVRVGQYLGAGNVKGAVTTARVAISVTYMAGMAAAILYFSLRHYLPYIFTEVPEVRSLVSSIIPILSLYMMFDISATCTWILKGSGRQTLGAVIALCTFSVGLSVAIPLLFKTALGIRAFWLALAGVIFAESLILFIIIQRTDWQRQVELAAERTGAFDALDNSDSNTETSSYHNNSSSVNQDVTTSSEVSSLLESPRSSSPTPRVTLPNSVIRDRLIFVFIMVSIFVAGVMIRLLFPVKVTIPSTDVCIPRSSHRNHTGYHFCNQTNFRFYQ